MTRQPSTTSRRVASWLGASLLLTMVARDARGDVVRPPPKNCPKGQVGVTSHGGPRCVPQAPTNCPPGWVGQVGGACVIHLCSGSCARGLRCKPASVCYEPRKRHWGFGAVHPGPEIAAPPHRLPHPVIDWIPIDICGAPTSRCPPPAECRPANVCLPPSVTRASLRTPPVTAKPPAPSPSSAPKARPKDKR
jgi:hypothetical protein